MVDHMIRIGAVALIVAGGTQAIASIFHLDNFKATSFKKPHWKYLQLAFAFFSLVAVIGFVGLFLAQADLGGYLGLIGFLLTLLGASAGVAASFIWGYVLPYLAKQQETEKTAMDLVGKDGPIKGLSILFILYGATFWPGVLILMVSVLSAGVIYAVAPILVIVGAVAMILGSAVKPLYALRNGGGIFLGVGLAWIGADIWPL